MAARDPLDIIEQRESRGRNVPNYKYGPGFTASGYYQIIDPTWQRWAKAAGVDISQYPTAMSAPREVQRAVAAKGFEMEGFRPWEAVKNLRGQEANYKLGAATPAAVANIEELQKKLLERYPGLQVTSGYRDPATNARVGGARNSQHTHGRAVDISLKGLPEDQQRAIVEYARSLGARGLGYYPSNQSVHFDVRQGAPAAWGANYSRTSLPGTPPWFQQIAQQHTKGPPQSVAQQAAAQQTPVTQYPDSPLIDRGVLGAENPWAKLADERKEQQQQAQIQQLQARAQAPPEPDPQPVPQPAAPPVDFAALMFPRIRRGLLSDDSPYSMGLLGAA